MQLRDIKWSFSFRFTLVFGEKSTFKHLASNQLEFLDTINFINVFFKVYCFCSEQFPDVKLLRLNLAPNWFLIRDIFPKLWFFPDGFEGSEDFRSSIKKAASAKRPFPVSIWLLTAATEKVKRDISWGFLLNWKFKKSEAVAGFKTAAVEKECYPVKICPNKLVFSF